jgi:hypothetical protein
MTLTKPQALSADKKRCLKAQIPKQFCPRPNAVD